MNINGSRILVVEDQPIIALAIADALEQMGVVVVGPASTLGEALQLASSEDFDAALLDIWLDGISAYSVGDVLRHRAIPFIVVSGAASTVEEPALFRTARRLLKPVRNAELRSALEAI